jgi:long-chain acyl-CoA synthetase
VRVLRQKLLAIALFMPIAWRALLDIKAACISIIKLKTPITKRMGDLFMLSKLDQDIDRLVAMITGAGSQLEVGTASVRGLELPVFLKAPVNLGQYCQYFFALHKDKEFLVYGQERLTFGQVYAQVIRYAGALQDKLGLAKGDRVAIAMRNYPEWIVSYLAITHMGCVAVPLNAWWQSEELGYALADSGARVVLADEERCRRISALDTCLARLVAVRVGHAMAEEMGWTRIEDILAGAPEEPWYVPNVISDDDISIMYTSGSTGQPKGAVSTHGAQVNACLNYLAMALVGLNLNLEEGRTAAEQQVMLLVVPLFHITGLVPVMLVSIAMGRKLVIMHKWDAGEALRLMEQEKCTYFTGVPTMSLELAQHPDAQKYDLSALTDIAGGGSPRAPEHVKRLAETFKGKMPALGYGLTETNAVGAGNIRSNYLAKPASTGRASAPLVQIKIFDEAGVMLEAGAVGEICIRTCANVRGYWNKPKETAAAFTREGWFKTGDLGYLDEDGYLFIVDRKKDIIIRGGENISCIEVESAIYAHPSVAEVCVFGLPDERLGEIVGAVVYLKADEQVEGSALIDFVARDLASFKVPAKLWLSAEPLPRLGSAKIDKVSVRKAYRAQYQQTA